jgi:hypothetical protein
MIPVTRLKGSAYATTKPMEIDQDMRAASRRGIDPELTSFTNGRRPS